MKITVGQAAPAFELYNSDKVKISLEQQRGKNVVLLFFPLAFTSTCTTELCSVRDNIASYNAVDAVVFGISVDSLFTLARFKEDQALNFDLLSDFNKEVSTAYGCLFEMFGFGMQGVSKRGAFVVDKSGKVRYAEVLENASELPDFESINRILKNS